MNRKRMVLASGAKTWLHLLVSFAIEDAGLGLHDGRQTNRAKLFDAISH